MLTISALRSCALAAAAQAPQEACGRSCGWTRMAGKISQSIS